MKFVTTVIALALTTAALAQAPTAKPAKPAEGHDKEHQHVTASPDHGHDDAHHKDHDHKAHHPEHDEKVQPKKK